MTLKSSKISSIKTIDRDVGVWELYANGRYIQRLANTVISSLDSREYPNLAILGVLDVTITQTSIKFGQDTVFEYEVWDFDEAMKLVETTHPGVYTALVEYIEYVTESAGYIERNANVKLGHYANAILGWFNNPTTDGYLDLLQIHQRTLSSIYLNRVFDEDGYVEPELAFLDKFHSYTVRDGIIHTPSGCISKQLADIFIRTAFITR